ncbi:hypothetical protein [Roseimaritima sediminicola]|uniref:hypothetical protein n=1 Tax=Roseimaritima sediminicola TaxID=2662066 RepID=UPI00129846B1|nr:hypothetical protein [Roseimaritima sediminicola]
MIAQPPGDRSPSRIGPSRLPSSQQWLHLLATLSVVWVAGGAACYRQQRVADFAAPPVVFESVPTLEELAAVVNRTDAIEKLQSNSATVTAPSMSDKGLSTTLVLHRDKRFRMRGKIPPLPVTILDLGSNEDVFWFQVPEGMRQTLYYAHHEQYARQSQRMILPVDPTWLISALGLVHLDPAGVIEGPTRRPDGQLEVRSRLAMPDGDYRRVCVVNDQTGVVTEQYLYGPDNELVARAQASQHRYYEAQQCSLPHRVEIHLQPAGGPPLALEMEIGQYTINEILSGDPDLFKMPQNAPEQIDLTRLSNLAQLGMGHGGAAGPVAGPVPPPTRAGPPPPRSTPLSPRSTPLSPRSSPLSPATEPYGAAAPGQSRAAAPLETPLANWPTREEVQTILQMPPVEGPAARTADQGYAPAASYRPALRGTQLR